MLGACGLFVDRSRRQFSHERRPGPAPGLRQETTEQVGQGGQVVVLPSSAEAARARSGGPAVPVRWSGGRPG